jgi:hypothetical protein
MFLMAKSCLHEPNWFFTNLAGELFWDLTQSWFLVSECWFSAVSVDLWVLLLLCLGMFGNEIL